MTDRWGRIGRILEEALARSPEERPAFVAAAAAGDPGVEAEVLSLLAHAGASETFLDPAHTKLAALEPGPAPPAVLREGAEIGAWRLVKPLGEGGMGTVWLVERTGGQFAQRGALKLIRSGLAYEEAIRRFRRERQILASLEHPNIARLLDGGSTAEGLPWLVMEFVEGRPLYAWCAEPPAPLEARLALFLDLCAAVHAAHQRLIVHRDLKPGNVMVTTAGTVKLLDFGVSKMFTPEAGEPADLRTTDLPFTPRYASPEQLRGEEVGTASDVYSLAVLLYELLTGAHPYPVRTGSAMEVVRAALDRDPTRPSAASVASEEAASLPPPAIADPRERSRRLAGDLDTIVLKAMARDPSRRYSSAERLAADVRSWLERRPIEARPDSWGYRTRKFVARNRVAVAAGALGLVALLAGLGVSLQQTAVARRERALAERRLRDVQALTNTLMFDVYDGIENMPGATAVRRSVIEKAAGFLDALAAEAGRDSSLRFSLADAYERLGITQASAPLPGDGATRASFASFEKSRALREGLLRDHPGSERALLGLVQVDTRLGAQDEVIARLPEALVMMTRARDAQQRLIDDHPANAAYAAAMARRRNNLGLALYLNDRVPEATAELEKAAAGFAALAARDSADWQSRRLLAMSLTVSSDCLFELPATAERARAAERHALALYDSLRRARPEDLDLAMRVADGHVRVAQMEALHFGEPDSGLVHADLAQRMIEAVAARDPGDHSLAIDVVNGRITRALLLAATHHDAAAEREIAAARPTWERWAAADSADTRFHDGRRQMALAEAIVALHRAETAGAPGRQRAWRTAQAAFARARAAYAFAPHRRAAGLLADHERWLERGIAACDSALAGESGGPTASR